MQASTSASGVPGFLRHPRTGVMQNSTQTMGAFQYFIGKRHHTVVGRKISLNTLRTCLNQSINGWIVRPIADNHRLLLINEMPGEGEADATTSASN